MRLTELVPPSLAYTSTFNPDITGISADSRIVRPGYVFVALPGNNTDGSQFIAQAIQAGATAIITTPSITFPHDSSQLAHIVTDTPRLLLSQIAARFYTVQPAHIVAVTGTNGKTSTAHFCRMLWQHCGYVSASIGTLGAIDQGNHFTHLNSPSLTTPDPVTLHQLLANMAQHGINTVALEASSHGLDQYRLDGVRVQAAAFTNLTRDHLDYHPSYAHYFQAKAALFSRVMPPGGVAVLNRDSAEYATLAAICQQRGQRILSYGWQGEDFRLLSLTPRVSGQRAVIAAAGKHSILELGLVGEFQVMNLLAALGLVVACGVELETAIAALPALPSVPGRMEKVPGTTADNAVFVDYAHTPDALEKALLALRPHTGGRLIVVFGCGGNRDKGKRPEMGHIATRYADSVIVTDDNPRHENPATIRKEILAGCNGAIEIANREEAIAYAIRQMQPNDIILLAGKGHEKTQIIGNNSIPFDDLAIAAQTIKEKHT